MSAPSISGFPFDRRESKVIAGLAQWMGLLGRLQILAAVFALIILLTGLFLYLSTELSTPTDATTSLSPPIVLGEVSNEALLTLSAIITVLATVFLRGGALLVSGAEDLEEVLATNERDQALLNTCLHRLHRYFILETGLIFTVLAFSMASWWFGGSG